MQKPELAGEWPTIYEMQMIRCWAAALGLQTIRISEAEREMFDFMEKLKDEMCRAFWLPASMLR